MTVAQLAPVLLRYGLKHLGEAFYLEFSGNDLQTTKGPELSLAEIAKAYRKGEHLGPKPEKTKKESAALFPDFPGITSDLDYKLSSYEYRPNCKEPENATYMWNMVSPRKRDDRVKIWYQVSKMTEEEAMNFVDSLPPLEP